MASWGWTVMVRPERDFVQAARSGQVGQCALKEARPPPWRVGLMVATGPAGQVTVFVPRSTTKRSLVKSLVALRTGGHLAVSLNPLVSKVSRVAPVSYTHLTL